MAKSLHCALLTLHSIMVGIALAVVVVSSLTLSQLIDQRQFLEGVYKSQPVANEVDLLVPSLEEEDAKEGGGVPKGTVTGPVILLVTVATASLLLSAFAFYSTLKMNIHLLSAFIFLMSLVLTLQASSGIWALVVRSRCVAPIRTSLIQHMLAYEVGAGKGIGGGAATSKGGEVPKGRSASPTKSLWAHQWDALQWNMKCCGIDGPDDYFQKGAIPLSCCAPSLEKLRVVGSVAIGSLENPTPPPTSGFSCIAIQRSGCLDILSGYVRTRLLWVTVFAIGATFVELIPLMVTAVYLISTKRELRKVYQ